jgi:cyclopropane-fatty-acyl-phospholipid synthase
MPALTLRPSARAATGILRDLFGPIRAPFAFRLWDGTIVAIGEGAPPFTVVLKSPEVFAQLMRDPSPGQFAEAYVSSALEIEGDLYSAMQVANAMEGLDISIARKLRILWAMWRG